MHNEGELHSLKSRGSYEDKNMATSIQALGKHEDRKRAAMYRWGETDFQKIRLKCGVFKSGQILAEFV